MHPRRRRHHQPPAPKRVHCRKMVLVPRPVRIADGQVLQTNERKKLRLDTYLAMHTWGFSLEDNMQLAAESATAALPPTPLTPSREAKIDGCSYARRLGGCGGI